MMPRPGQLGTLGGMGKRVDEARTMRERVMRAELRPEEARGVRLGPEATYLRGAAFGTMDMKERVQLLDREGLARAVLYPTLGLLWEAEVMDAELSAAYCRAYNRWIADFCRDSGGRLVPIAHLALMFIVLGTIYLGIATPTEAAAFGVVASLILAALNRQVSRAMLAQVMVTTVRASSMIMLIVTSAFVLSFALAILSVPAQLTELVTSWKLTPVTFVLVLVVFYLILGTFMEALSMMVTTMPILVPVLKTMGVDLVWFGIIMVILLEAALVSPPEGLNLYIIQGIRKSVSEEAGLKVGTMVDLWIGVLPFMVGMAICIALLLMFPGIALWLPNMVMGR
jgi:TRAP-type C4-dicarboxylate transport system permease large subunit